MNIEDLQKALDNRPNITLDILPMNHDNCIVLLEQNKRFLAWLEYFTRKLAAYRTELELPVGEWLTKNAKTLRELAREEGILTEKWFAHQVPDTEYDKQQDGKWVSVETVTALLTQVFREKVIAQEKNVEYAKLVAGQAKEYAEKLQDKVLADRRQLSDSLDRLAEDLADEINKTSPRSGWARTVQPVIWKWFELLASSEKKNLNLALAFADVRCKKHPVCVFGEIPVHYLEAIEEEKQKKKKGSVKEV